MLKMHPNEVRRAIVEHRLGAFRKGNNGAYLITLKQIDAFLIPAGADWSLKVCAGLGECRGRESG